MEYFLEALAAAFIVIVGPLFNSGWAARQYADAFGRDRICLF